MILPIRDNLLVVVETYLKQQETQFRTEIHSINELRKIYQEETQVSFIVYLSCPLTTLRFVTLATFLANFERSVSGN